MPIQQMIKNKLNDLLYEVDRDGYALTRFLDLEEQREVMALKSHDIDVIFFGGYPDAERRRCIVYNKMYEITEDYFDVVQITSPYTTKYYECSHRHVLGTIMGLGVERSIFGDICFNKNEIIIFVIKEMADYLCQNLFEINHQTMDFKVNNEITLEESPEEIRVINIASFRLDALISKVLCKSREDAKYFIKQGFVKINQVEVYDSDEKIDIGDILSIRKFGRVELKELQNVSKKDRLNVIVGIKH